jgi:hypothetical protein
LTGYDAEACRVYSPLSISDPIEYRKKHTHNWFIVILASMGYCAYMRCGPMPLLFLKPLVHFPLIGPPIIWAPVVVYHFSQSHTSAAIIVLVAGLLVSNLDNILRPWIQNRVGKIHPLITIFGVLIGLSLFGISGLVIGPVLIALAINLGGVAVRLLGLREE